MESRVGMVTSELFVLAHRSEPAFVRGLPFGFACHCPALAMMQLLCHIFKLLIFKNKNYIAGFRKAPLGDYHLSEQKQVGDFNRSSANGNHR